VPASLPEGSQPSDHPASTFCSVLAVLSRHSSSPAADVVRARDRGFELDHAPPASFSAAFRYRFLRASAWPANPLSLA